MRKNSLSDLNLGRWNWNPFFQEMCDQLSIFNVQPYPVDKDFLYKDSGLYSKKKISNVIASTWACKIEKIRQIRLACIKESENLSVFNLLISPLHIYDLPFFGADFVTLPNGHLLALDFQPALQNDLLHTEEIWSKLIPLHNRWQAYLPSGGSIPQEAQPFFSPGFLWSRLPLGIKGDEMILEILLPAFREYLSLYIEFILQAQKVSKTRSLDLLEGQKSYMNYRSKKDPARGMLTRFYGKRWTEEYIQKVLFDL